MKSDTCRAWGRAAISSDVVAGAGTVSQAQSTTSEIFHHISMNSHGCSLDFTKAYDLMDLAATIAFM